MIVKVESSSLIGINQSPIKVEVDIVKGLPSFDIVGLPDVACRESQVRVRGAIKNSGFEFPSKKIIINLAPANIKKEGSGFDLPIALGILAASGQIDAEILDKRVFCGELSLDGKVKGISGLLPRAAGYANKDKEFVFPRDNIKEVAFVPNIKLKPIHSLDQAMQLDSVGLYATGTRASISHDEFADDYSDVRGQAMAKRGIEVACAGNHNLVMVGPPGSGKTMLAKRIPSILPELTFEESLATTKIHSVAGCLKSDVGLINNPPFRAPHHTISDAALVGGGTHPKPGEISLAHRGILFLDEMPEFRRNVLEVLRQPLEEGKILISRASQTLAFPAQFMLVGAMNPCPCGFGQENSNECYCTPIQVKNYIGKISGPLSDRIDIHLYIAALKRKDFEAISVKPESSKQIRERVLMARRVQRQRYKKEKISCNGQLEGKDVEKHCPLSTATRKYLGDALEKLGFSARAFHKVLTIARTIADMNEAEKIELNHIQEAVHYRFLDRKNNI